ncbi:MAG: phosphotransferase, partial [Candidatus Nanopelagicales bacterium]
MAGPDVRVDADLARALVRLQHPDLGDLPVRHVGTGWDNAVFRLGPELCIRLPRRELAAGLVCNEVRWLPELDAELPLPIPAPVRAGEPALGYPWMWSICRWLPG